MKKALIRVRSASQSQLYTALLVFLFFSGFYLFTSTGVIYIADSIANYQTTLAIVENRSLIISCDIGQKFVQRDPAGECYSKYEIGLPLTSIPLYIAGRFATSNVDHSGTNSSPAMTELAVSTLNQFLTAATCAVLFLIVLHFGANKIVALSVTFFYGLMSLAWPYSSLHFSQPVVGFAVTLAFLMLVRNGHFGWDRYLVAGVGLGWATLTRLDSLPLVGVIVILETYRILRAKKSLLFLLRTLLLLLFPVLMAVGAYLVHNYIRTGGQPNGIGYADEGWTTPFWIGTYGLLFSFGKGLFIFSPLVIYAIVGLNKLWRRQFWYEASLIASLCIVQIAFYASWWSWEGGWTWGPRFLVSTHALLLVGLLPWLEKQAPPRLLILLGGVSFLIQFIGVSTSTGVYVGTTHYTYKQTLFYLPASQIIGQAIDLLNRRYMLLVTTRAMGTLSSMQTAAFASICLALMGLAAFLLRKDISTEVIQE